MENSILLLNSFKKLPKSSQLKLKKLTISKTLKKGEIIANAGEIHDCVYVLESGIARSFYKDAKGKEYIRNLFVPVRGLGALGALILNKPSKFSYDCLSDCKFQQINFKEFKKLAKEDVTISNFYAELLEIVFLELEAKVYDLSVLNATERYLKLRRQIPSIENLIPQYHVAAFLNITPVQLSRIRKEMYSK